MLMSIISALLLILMGILICYGVYIIFVKLGIVAIIIFVAVLVVATWITKTVFRS